MPNAKNINDILALIHQDVIGERVDTPHRIWRENYKVTKFIVDSYDQAVEEILKYYCYHMSMWYNSPVQLKMPADMAFSNVKIILDNTPGGWIQAIKDCISGRNGGLLEKIDLIAEALRKEAVEKYMSHIVGMFINPMDYNNKVRLMIQYLRQYGRCILPQEKLLSPFELANNCSEIIKYHANLVCSFRKLLQ